MHTPDDVARNVARAAKTERKLLACERRAERNLIDARQRLAAEQDRLERAMRRVEKRRAAVEAAGETLEQRQAERAAGPVQEPADA